MATRMVEHTFTLVSETELDEAIKYVADKDMVTLLRPRLRTIANNAGKSMHAKPGLTPRQAAARAMQAYHNEFPRVQFQSPYFDGYVHAVAKIMNGRSPHVAEKRRRDRALSELAVVSYGIQRTPDIDPRTQYEITHGLTGHPLERA